MKFTQEYFYYIIVINNGGNYAYDLRVHNSRNLASVFAGIAGLHSITPCATWKEAKELAAYWNDCYKANGSYAF